MTGIGTTLAIIGMSIFAGSLGAIAHPITGVATGGLVLTALAALLT